MLTVIGHVEAGDLADDLLQCHERVRRFLCIARRLSAARTEAPREIAETAGAVVRYFSVAFPHHLADEEILASSLAGRDPQVDRAFAVMSADHLAHACDVTRLVDTCRVLAAEPRRAAELGPALALLVTEVETLLLPHLELEERDLFPFLRRLPTAEQDAFRRNARRRRGASAGVVAREPSHDIE